MSAVEPVVPLTAADIAPALSSITYVLLPELLASFITSAFATVKLPVISISTASLYAAPAVANALPAESFTLYTTAFANPDIVVACVILAVLSTVTVPAFAKNGFELAAIFVAVSSILYVLLPLFVALSIVVACAIVAEVVATIFTDSFLPPAEPPCMFAAVSEIL